MTEAFANRFWQFVREAGYRPEKRTQEYGEPPRYEMYRFLDGKDGYPEMIELLSRHPDVLGEPKGFVIELEDYIVDSGNYWIYGHSHTNINAMIGNTQCLSNQLGYVFSNEYQDFSHGKYITI